MKPAALTMVLALALSASAFAQQESRNEREYKDVYSNLTVGLETTIPGGDAFANVRWSELISGGVGLDLEYSRLWRENSWVYCGYFVGLNLDSYGGRSSTQFNQGTSTFIDVRTSRMNMAGVTVGGRIRENFNGWHMDQSAGLGAAIYTKQEVDILGTGPDNLELIKSSVNYTALIEARVGAPLGNDVELNLGVGYRINGAPQEGKDFTGTKFKSMSNLVIGLSLDIGF
jgi:hypothetical protein